MRYALLTELERCLVVDVLVVGREGRVAVILSTVPERGREGRVVVVLSTVPERGRAGRVVVGVLPTVPERGLERGAVVVAYESRRS